MSEVPEIQPAGGAPPNTLVLNYLANVSTPTRARRVAFVMILVLAALNFMVLGIAIWLVADLRDWNFAMRSIHAFYWFVIDEFFALLALAASGLGTLILPGLAFAVRRGNAAACRAVGIYLAIVIVTIALLTIGFVAGTQVDGRGRILAHPNEYPWLLLLVPCAVVLLLLRDMITLLRWIARNPFAEESPAFFLPTANALR